MKSSKLTSKFQATIPKNIRKALKLKSGDSIIFEVLSNGTVVMRKARAFDKEYLQALKNTLSEWESEYDEEDFRNLQDI